MNIRWSRPTASGLCDRLIDLTMLCAYARSQSARIHMDWPRLEVKSIDAKHRKMDILLDNVRAFITFPPEIVFGSATCDRSFDRYLGGGIDFPVFHSEHMSKICSYSEFLGIIASVGRDFLFCDAIKECLSRVPDRLVGFHIRRGDKVRDEPSDGNFIHVSEKDHLDSLTYRAMDYFIDSGQENFFLCGDEDDKTVVFSNYLVGKGMKIFSLPAMEKWQSTYYDIAVLSKCETVITSNRYSSFSRFPAVIGGGTCLTVYGMEERHLI